MVVQLQDFVHDTEVCFAGEGNGSLNIFMSAGNERICFGWHYSDLTLYPGPYFNKNPSTVISYIQWITVLNMAVEKLCSEINSNRG